MGGGEGRTRDAGSNPISRRSFLKCSIAAGIVTGLAGEPLFAHLASAGQHRALDPIVQPMLDALRDGQTLDLGGEFFTLTGPVHLRNKRGVTIDNGTLHLPASEHGRNSAVLLVMRCAYTELGTGLVLDGGLKNPRYHPDLEAQHALHFARSANCTSRAHVGGVHGDGVYVRGSTDITVGGVMDSCGRHGISIVEGCARITLDGATITNPARDAIDIEPLGKGRAAPDCTITNSEIHGEIHAQGQLGTLTISHNRIEHLTGILRGNLATTDPSAHLVYTDNVALDPKSDGSSLGLNVMGWQLADVLRNTQPYDTTKKNYTHFVKARNVAELHVDDNVLTGLEGHGSVLRHGPGLGLVTSAGNTTV